VYRTVAALILIGAACGTLLYGINAQTYGEIEKNRTQKAREIMRSLLKQPLPDEIQWVEGISGSCTQGYFLKRIENGYSGPINFFALYQQGASREGVSNPERLSLRVTRHQETPGIGDFIDHERDSYLPDQDGQSVAQWQELDNIVGATITHRAIKKAAQNIQLAVKYHQEQYACVE
jgi:Na+-translocating ferredoxin:NAD+ oxidoreductase RnfG subunit